MGRSADVVVVGSGIIGASIAYQLADRGLKVVVVDKAAGPAEGSTGASAAFIRCRYTQPKVIKLASDSQIAFRNWSSFTGLREPRSSYSKVGVLWMLGQPLEVIQREQEALAAAGVDASVLSPAELTSRYPSVSVCDAGFDLTGAIEHECREGDAFLFEDEGGFIDPVGATQDLVEASKRHGAEFRYRAALVAVKKTGSRVTGVTLNTGDTLDAPLVVNAGGPWCNQINEMAGVDLQWTLTPTRIQMLYRAWPHDAGPIPITIDMATMNGYRLEESGRQILAVSGRPDDEDEAVQDPDSFKTSPDAAFKEINLAALHHRFPTLEARGLPGGLAGLYTINHEDHHPIVGPTEIEGFWVANGFSGHGLKLAPGIGSMVARSVTGETRPFDTEVAMDLFSRDREPLQLGVKNVFA